MKKYLVRFMYFSDIRFEEIVHSDNAVMALTKSIYTGPSELLLLNWCEPEGFHIDISVMEE